MTGHLAVKAADVGMAWDESGDLVQIASTWQMVLSV